MNYWTTKEGVKIAYSKLETSHLQNILKWIEKRAKKGIELVNGGCGSSAEDVWDEVHFIQGKEVKDYYNYKELQRELKKRQLHDTKSTK